MIITSHHLRSLSFTGSIFHVRVHTVQKGLEHALLYSIGVNLPAHRVGQLDRILVLASPINDINIHAWDLNRVKRFMRLDIGVQMELCSSCMISQTQSTSITFILDKVFQDECIDFLCHEAHISNQPVKDGALIVYPVKHTCQQPSRGLSDPLPIPPPAYHEIQHPRQLEQAHMIGNPYQLEGVPPELPPRNYKLYTHNGDPGRDKFTTRESATKTAAGSDDLGNEFIPPRDIARRNFESAIPAIALPYTNFQPHMFQQSSSSFDSPYQISSRIIITNSGELQYERNILGNKSSQFHGGFHFKQDIPLPPRSSATSRQRQLPKRTSLSPKAPKGSRDPHLVANIRSESKGSELIESDDTYVYIPDLVKEPTKKPPPPPPPSTAADSQTDPSPHPHSPLHSSSASPSSSHESQTHFSSTSSFECPLPPRTSPTHKPHYHLPSHTHTITSHLPTLPSKMHSSHTPRSDPLKSRTVSAEPLTSPDISFEQQPVYISSSSDPPTHHCHPTTSLPHLSRNEYHLSEEATRPLSLEDSDDYDDVVVVPQQVRVAGNTPEVRNGHFDSVGSTSPTLSPSKPAVKPRLKLPDPSHTHWGDIGRSCTPKRLNIKRTLTIPRNPHVNTAHYVLNSYSTDDASSSTSEKRALHTSSENVFSSGHENKSTFLTYSPLTPPIPKPRVNFTDHLPSQYTEDDSQVRKSTSLPKTVPFLDLPISDV